MPVESASLPEVNIPDLMHSLSIDTLRSETERTDYLRTLTPEQFVDSVKQVSSQARGVDVAENTPPLDNRVVIFEGITNLSLARGIAYIAPRRDLGEQALAAALDTAKELPSLAAASALLRLTITQAHTQINGNGAAARFHYKLFTEGYDGTEASNAEYRELLTSQNRPRGEHLETEWQAASAAYQLAQVSEANSLPVMPFGQRIPKWNGRHIMDFPFIRMGKGGIYMVEDNFAAAFDLDFIHRTGRNPKPYLVTRRERLRKRTYVDSEPLLHDATLDESDIAQEIGDAHKVAHLATIVDHFRTGSHPAFRRLKLPR